MHILRLRGYENEVQLCVVCLQGSNPASHISFLFSPPIPADLTLGKDKSLACLAGKLGPSLDHTMGQLDKPGWAPSPAMA